MNINRHNYEEYFILYMDNELNSDGRRMVEAFVQQHPDLKEELDTLLQYKLTPDTNIVFDGKEDLLKENGHPVITINNCSEWLTLYADDELNEEQKRLTERFMAANPAAMKEFQLLQKTKLQPEQVIFTNKESLYRREEPVRRIIPYRWRAAAAILILALGITSVLVLNKKPSGGKKEVVTVNPPQESSPAENKIAVQPEKDNSIAASEQKTTEAKAPSLTETKANPVNPVIKEEKNIPATANKRPVAPENKVPSNIPSAVIKDDATLADNNKLNNNLPLPLNNPNIKENNKAASDAVASANKPENTLPQELITKPVVTSADIQPSNIIQAGYQETDNPMLEQPDGKKNKNRGIFRKIARTFEKRTNIDPTDNNRLLVGGLAIKLK